MRARSIAAWLVVAAAVWTAGRVAPPATARDEPTAGRIVVGSKNFAESRILGEIFARLLEARTDLDVERRLGLAGTQVCFEALRSGAIDVYPEYTGTGLLSILAEEPRGSARETLGRVRDVFLSRWDLHWLAPLGFEQLCSDLRGDGQTVLCIDRVLISSG